MDKATTELFEFVKRKGITYKAVSNATGISYDKIRRCALQNRKLRADEFLLVCRFLEKDPLDFIQETKAS